MVGHKRLLKGTSTLYAYDFASDSQTNSLSDFMQIVLRYHSLTNTKIQRLKARAIFDPFPYPILCPIDCCMGQEWLNVS
jgi:hypothetical protein